MIRVFVGTEPKTRVMYDVLCYTIRKHATQPVEITPMIGSGWEYSIAGIKVGTGFSLRRWMIPAACNWQGKALYLDADQIVFSDIVKMPEAVTNWGAATVACTYQPDKYSKTPWAQTSVMLIDCDRAKGQWGFEIDKILHHLKKRPTPLDYANFMHGTWLKHKPAVLPVEWNHLNVYKPNVTKLLHMTKENSQPPYQPDTPIAKVWRSLLKDAILAGAVDRQAFEEGLASWGKKQDWRPTNGLHPVYAEYLPLFSRT